ncbi:ABC transporter ATP-binding protein [Verrucomicrobiales bacterium]|jgi:putative ABC transport system ATP-binding protein|nr:ABC transporter ATP-binding protein [Verrucomicrobiales bacterium]
MITCQNLKFAYPGERFALEIDDLCIKGGAKVALVGASGCGKTTLFNLISGILIPESGSLDVFGETPGSLSASARQQFRIRTIGMVPQNFELLDYLTIRENIELPFRITSVLSGDASVRKRCEELAERSGISDQLSKFPHELSQGERQRAAICRALIASPALILADEPTGNLDPANQEKLVSLLLEEADRLGSTLFMITHEPELIPRFDRCIDLLQLRREARV